MKEEGKQAMKKIKADNLTFTILSAVFGGLGALFFMMGTIFLLVGADEGEDVFPLLGIIFMAVGISFLIVTVILLVIAAKRTRELRSLVAEGFYIMATFDRTDYDYHVQVNYRNPQRLFCRYTDEYGTVHEFRSGCFWRELREEVYTQPTEVPVYLRRGDYTKYYVDITPLIDGGEEIQRHY